jgi:indole-3-glycerol phosphate synthase
VHERKTLIDTLLALDEQRRGHVLLGINNRDLKTQTVDLGTTETLADLGPPGVPIVAESGIQTRQDVDRMHAAGARALLIGERFMRADDIAVSVRELFG